MTDQNTFGQTERVRVHVFRLMPHQDLKKSIQDFAKANSIKAGALVTCVGSLEQINLRFANQKTGYLKKGYYEIISLTGTFSDISCHLHLGVSDEAGSTAGGHLLNENLIYTTAELVIAELYDLEFTRELDNTYGYQELKINSIKSLK
jgi:predicted DNA-binding protein with PD1-like motif